MEAYGDDINIEDVLALELSHLSLGALTTIANDDNDDVLDGNNNNNANVSAMAMLRSSKDALSRGERMSKSASADVFGETPLNLPSNDDAELAAEMQNLMPLDGFWHAAKKGLSAAGRAYRDARKADHAEAKKKKKIARAAIAKAEAEEEEEERKQQQKKSSGEDINSAFLANRERTLEYLSKTTGENNSQSVIGSFPETLIAASGAIDRAKPSVLSAPTQSERYNSTIVLATAFDAFRQRFYAASKLDIAPQVLRTRADKIPTDGSCPSSRSLKHGLTALATRVNESFPSSSSTKTSAAAGLKQTGEELGRAIYAQFRAAVPNPTVKHVTRVGHLLVDSIEASLAHTLGSSNPSPTGLSSQTTALLNARMGDSSVLKNFL